jgi:hypothetical protein
MPNQINAGCANQTIPGNTSFNQKASGKDALSEHYSPHYVVLSKLQTKINAPLQTQAHFRLENHKNQMMMVMDPFHTLFFIHRAQQINLLGRTVTL